MSNTKRKIMVPFMVFLIGIGILGGVICNIRKHQQEQGRASAKLNAMTYAERMKTDIMDGISVTDTLEQVIVSEDGKINKFSEIAENMMTDSIQSIQIAPDGVVTDIYPKEGNEAGKIDLLNDKDRGEISRYARDHHVLVMQGPFALKQGGDGIAVRNPVYVENADGQEYFWGFTIVIIRVPDMFVESLEALSNFGYDYKISKTVTPWSTTYKEVYCSKENIKNPVSYNFALGGDQWTLEVAPKDGWYNNDYLCSVFIGGILIVLLLTSLTAMLMLLEERRQKLKKIAVTDSLTGIYNRHGFDESMTKYLKQYPMGKYVGAEFDIDDFKFINDLYGHSSGDKALQILSEQMQSFFPDNAVLGRNGGDEFCIFIPNYTCAEISQKMEQFAKMERSFEYKGEQYPFTISLGYAEYPLHAKNHSQLMRCADAALYEVKLRGKNGCLAYHAGIRLGNRTRLGFALKDVSENLPGAFIIYKADKKDDEILFANREFTRLAGCKSMNDLLRYTQGSFRNLIHEDERTGVQQSVWQQVEEGHTNDYVHFHMKKEDGTYLQVLDHGRIVQNDRYGKVFYALIMDCKSMKRHYGDFI